MWPNPQFSADLVTFTHLLKKFLMENFTFPAVPLKDVIRDIYIYVRIYIYTFKVQFSWLVSTCLVSRPSFYPSTVSNGSENVHFAQCKQRRTIYDIQNIPKDRVLRPLFYRLRREFRNFVIWPAKSILVQVIFTV